MCVHPQYIEAIWKEVLEEVIFSLNIIETPKFSRDGTETKREKEKEKLQKSLQITGELTFWEDNEAWTSQTLFNVTPFSPPPSYHFKNPFQNLWENFLNSFWTIL
jgi:hypothetical protein